MTTPLLALTALAPAASLARSAASSGAQLGSNFLSLLSKITTPSSADAADQTTATDTSTPTANAAAVNSQSDKIPSDKIPSDKIQSWSQRFVAWLRQQPKIADATGATESDQPDESKPLNIELSLDAMDQPRLAINGQQQPELDAALASDPIWLHEFRDMALDRAESLGNYSTAQPQSLTLTINQKSATMKPVIQWK